MINSFAAGFSRAGPIHAWEFFDDECYGARVVAFAAANSRGLDDQQENVTATGCKRGSHISCRIHARKRRTGIPGSARALGGALYRRRRHRRAVAPDLPI